MFPILHNGPGNAPSKMPHHLGGFGPQPANMASWLHHRPYLKWHLDWLSHFVRLTVVTNRQTHRPSVATGHIVSKYKFINVHNGQQKPNLRCKKGVKWIGRSAGNSGSWVDDKRYQDWYKYGEMEGEFQILGVETLKLWAQNDVRTNGAKKISVEESEGTSWMTGMQGWM